MAGFYKRVRCGHVEESGIARHIGRQGEDFPILDQNWRINGDLDQDAHAFLATADTPFTIEDAQQVVNAGSKLVGKYDDVRIESRHVQGIHMRTMAPMAQHSRILLRKRQE